MYKNQKKKDIICHNSLFINIKCFKKYERQIYNINIRQIETKKENK